MTELMQQDTETGENRWSDREMKRERLRIMEDKRRRGTLMMMQNEGKYLGIMKENM